MIHIKKIGITLLWLFSISILLLALFLNYQKESVRYMTDRGLEERGLLNKVESSRYLYNTKQGGFYRFIKFKDDDMDEYSFIVFEEPKFIDMMMFKSKKKYNSDYVFEGYKNNEVQFDAQYNFLSEDGITHDYDKDYKWKD